MIALLVSGGLSLAVSLVFTRFLIDWLRAHRIGQPIREEGPQGHQTKAGTPTMGGIAIVVGAVVGYTVAHLRSRVFYTRSGIFVLLLVVGAGLVGFLDDWIKITRARNLGLNKRMKVLGLLAVAVAFGWACVAFTGVHTTLSFTRYDSFANSSLLDIDFGRVGFVVWSVLLIMAMTNAVNLTDGLDGLAAGSSLFAFAAFTIIGFWAFRNPGTYDIEHALDLAVVAAAMLGGCTGFLWWNAHPAKIFMGDTGSLAIGAALAGLALTLSTNLLLPIIGALFVVETLSVIIQVFSFRTFGRRVFRMAPIHHHYELNGWPETTVIVRFWIIAGLATALALGLFYADFTTLPGSAGS
ncbi:phospho-N-acetylmuramoyl-pentapeptide-transferase [Aquihabitans sp. G128]|uniref:phospho-N-acetylmuramoyl-pentapeptide- transferase n=1 Tax=Aquihabitans sp. G128 TaxID=2849779 RepID=UPI001C210060|nr:phospho-N-acetylmuramoyl-pentapeptide-transferase [Aquihabitans sp. G128]QXC62273.1 phospho-N-acetylmuramoyl-pentapeptide-transferase [Aquihabitans sp. G128]